MVDLDVQPVLEALAMLAPFTSTDPTRLALNGVFADSSEQVLVATDGRRLTKVSLDTFPFDHDAIVPVSKVLTNGILQGHDGPGGIGLAEHDHSMKFTVKSGPWTYRVTCIDGTYPNYRQVIPAEIPSLPKIDFGDTDAERIASVLKQVIRQDSDAHAVICGDLERAALLTPTGSEDTPYSVLDLAESTFTRVDAPVIVHFNARYLMQALNAGFRSAEINDPFSPVRFTGLDGALHVLMPLRDTDTSRVLQCVGIATPLDSSGEEHSYEQEETESAMTTTTEPTIRSGSTSEPGADAQTAQGTAGTPGQDDTKQDLMETFQDLLTEAQERVRDAEKAVRELKRTAKDLQRHYRDREKEIRSRERDVAKNVKLIERLQEAVAA